MSIFIPFIFKYLQKYPSNITLIANLIRLINILKLDDKQKRVHHKSTRPLKNNYGWVKTKHCQLFRENLQEIGFPEK